MEGDAPSPLAATSLLTEARAPQSLQWVPGGVGDELTPSAVETAGGGGGNWEVTATQCPLLGPQKRRQPPPLPWGL